MSHPVNTDLKERLGQEFEEAYDNRDFTAMDAVIKRAKEWGFSSEADDMATRYIDLEDAYQ